MIGVLIFIVTVFVSRQIGEKAMGKLDSDKKAQLVDLFNSGNRAMQYIFLISSLLGYYLVIRFTEINSQTAFIMFMVVMMCYVAFSNFRAYRKLKANNFPGDYITSYLMSSTIRIIGMIVFFGLMIIDF